MLRSLLVAAAALALTACSGAHYEGGGRSGGGAGGVDVGGDGEATDDGWPSPTDESEPDPAEDDDPFDSPASADDVAIAPYTSFLAPRPIGAPAIAFDEHVGSSSLELASECPDARHLHAYAGPASWPKKYGVTGVCVGSRYACRMPTKDPDFRRFENPKDATDGAWPVALGIPVLDGRGNRIGTTTVTAAKLNFGQRKWLEGKERVYAFSVGSGADDVSGWVPASCIGWDGKTVPDASCVSKPGSTPSGFPVFSGRKPSAKYDAVLKVRIVTPDWWTKRWPWLAGLDPDALKITCNAPNAPHRSIGDYLPQLSADKTFYKVNLLANVPGISPALGGIASDTLRVAHYDQNGDLVSDGLTFHMLLHVSEVVVYLFQAGSSVGAPFEGAHVGFVYGYVLYPNGGGWLRRYGWLPTFALAPI